MTGRLSTASAGAQLSLTTAFHHYFGEGDRSDLDITYRFNSRIGEIANRFIQQNPHQLSKPLNSLTSGDKKAVTLLADDQLEPLLDKLSGYAKPDERILVWRVITTSSRRRWKKRRRAGQNYSSIL